MASLPVKPLPSGHLQLLRQNLIIPPSMVSAGYKRKHFLGVSSYIDESLRHMKSLRSWSNRRRVSKSAGVSMPVASAESFPVVSWESWKPDKTTLAPSLSDVIWPAAGILVIIYLHRRNYYMLTLL